MRPERSLMRAVVSVVLALAFLFAVQPGTMASMQPTGMAMSSFGMASCDHMKMQKDTGNPCKGMAVCMGMLNCYGMAAVATVSAQTFRLADRPSVPYLHQTATGLNVPPDNPPPIA